MKALMKNLITISILLCCTIALPSCQNDDWKKEVEKLRNELDIQKQLFDASQNNIYITDVTTANDGYTITLSLTGTPLCCKTESTVPTETKLRISLPMATK